MRWIFLPSLLLLPTLVPAQGRDRLTVDRLYGSPEFFPQRFGPARWLDDCSGYTTLEPGRGGVVDIVRYEPASGRRDVLVAAQKLVPEGARQPIVVEDYAWSPDGRKLLVYTNSERVWRDNTRGDYWLLDLEGGAPRQLGKGFDPSRLMFAKFDPSGSRVAYVYRNNLYVEDLAAGGIRQLTQDGSDTVINGTFDWVYEEEFHVQDGFRWSPDGQRIAYWQIDASGIGEFYMVDNLSDLYARIVPVQYPKAGTTNSACRVGVIPAGGGDTVWMEVDGDPRNTYIARLDWAASSSEVVLQHLNRQQNVNRVMLGDAATGEVRTVLTEGDAAWLDVVDDLRWLDGGKRFTWLSERDGWRHVWIVPRDGGEPRLVTPGDYDIVSIAHIDAKGGFVYAIASPDDASRRFLYRVPLAGGPPERLTPKDARGTHEYQISPDARFAIHTWSTFGTPPVVDLVALPGHEVLPTLVDNAAVRARVDALAQGPVKFFRVDTGDEVVLDGFCMKPPDFDPAKKWPVIFYVYGEPWKQTVIDEWGSLDHLWHVLLAQHGYVVMSLDNRGTPAPRGRDWRKCVHGRIGVLSSRDQAAGLGAIVERWDWVDKDRIGVWGWSGGGSMTLNMMFRYPKLYRTGIAVAPVPDQRLYDTIYQERYSGLPSENPDGYRDGSPITFARNLEGNLLLIHGTGDDNVHYQGTERLIDELIKHDKQFAFMAYPNRSHGIFERANTRRHLFKLMTGYFLDKLPPGGR
jgi:dipeptidyl-peptidase-4